MFSGRCVPRCLLAATKSARSKQDCTSSHRWYVSARYVSSGNGDCRNQSTTNIKGVMTPRYSLKLLPHYNKGTKVLWINTRLFQSVGEYHSVADETLDAIQDAIEDMIESVPGVEDVEVTVASGVLTLNLPDHGTWVINKQTPNEQIWWSSPLSGPRRYEYNEKTGHWVYTRSQPGQEKEEETLGTALVQEMKELLNLDLDLEV